MNEDVYSSYFPVLKKKAPKKSINHPFINHISIHEIKNLYKYMFKTYTLAIIHKKKFISNGMISFNLHTVSIAHPSAKSQAPLFTITLSVSEFKICLQR